MSRKKRKTNIKNKKNKNAVKMKKNKNESHYSQIELILLAAAISFLVIMGIPYCISMLHGVFF